MCGGAEVALAENLWLEVGLHNITRGEWLIFYNNSEGTRSGQLTTHVVVQFRQLRDKLEPFITDITCSLAILKHIYELKKFNVISTFKRR